MKNLIKLVLILFLPVVLFSCTKDENAESCKVSDTQAVLMGEEEAFQAFSKILSSAVYNEQTLRSFLKAEALRQIDKDYDVFYPWVRDAQVDEDRTLRDVLKQYDEENRLEAIEMALPLLTIYVPDWSWLDEHCFSVNSWDVSAPEVAVSYRKDGHENILYGNGERMGSIPAGMFPDHPVLIVKENERIERGESTRASEGEFTFIDPEYDGTREEDVTKGSFYTDEYTFSASPEAPSFHIANADVKVRSAYAIAEAANMPQRDYIFYDMTATKDTGAVNMHFMEHIKYFRINPSLSGLTDDTTTAGGDLTLRSEDMYPGDELTNSQMRSLSWAEGSLEVVFYVRAGSAIAEKHKSVTTKMAFSPTKVFHNYYINLFGTLTWRCYYTEAQYLVPRWITAGFDLFTWNLKVFPYVYSIAVEEADSGATVTRTVTNSFQFATNVTTSYQTGDDVKYGYGTGASSTITDTRTMTENYQQENDSWGSFIVSFSDPILTSAPAYMMNLYVYQTGCVDVIMIPRKTY